MATEEVIVKTGPTLEDASGTILVFDGSISQSHALSAEVSQHPVEQGVDVVDHVQPQPVRVSLKGVVSARPLYEAGYPGREIDAWAALRSAIESAQPVTLITTLATYENMVISALSVAREKGTGQAIYPDLELRQVRIVESLTTLLPAAVKKIAQQKTAPGTTDVGKQPTDVPTSAQRASLARQLLDFARGGAVTP